MAKPTIPYALRHREAVRPGLVRILNAMGKDARVLSEKPESELAESIHRLRTLIKRLRAYLWFLRPILNKTFYTHHNSSLRRASCKLSKTRNLHAIASALTQAAIPKAEENQLHALVQVSQAFARQTAQKPNLNARILEQVADTVIQTLSETARSVKQSARSWPSPAHRVKKALKRTRKTVKKSRQNKNPDLVHEWRKKTKRLYYILQLTARLPHMGTKNCLGKVDMLQETLGDFQDTVVAEDHLYRDPPETEITHLHEAILLLRKRRKILLKQAHDHWDSILEND